MRIVTFESAEGPSVGVVSGEGADAVVADCGPEFHPVNRLLGTGRLEGPSDAEAEEMYRLARRSIVAATDIPAGTVLTAEHLTVKRPGYGIKPKDLDVVVGRTAKVDIEQDDILLWDML